MESYTNDQEMAQSERNSHSKTEAENNLIYSLCIYMITMMSEKAAGLDFVHIMKKHNK